MLIISSLILKLFPWWIFHQSIFCNPYLNQTKLWNEYKRFKAWSIFHNQINFNCPCRVKRWIFFTAIWKKQYYSSDILWPIDGNLWCFIYISISFGAFLFKSFDKIDKFSESIKLWSFKPQLPLSLYYFYLTLL